MKHATPWKTTTAAAITRL